MLKDENQELKLIKHEDGVKALGPSNWDARDDLHFDLVTRSPQFTMCENEQIKFKLWGGISGSPSLPLPADHVEQGLLGLALRHVSSDQYVRFGRKTRQGPSWEEIDWRLNQTSRPEVIPGERYTLDFIDTKHGSWGHAMLDDVMFEDCHPGCTVSSVSGRWEPVHYSSANTTEISYSVETKFTDTTVRTEGWKSSVSATVSAGFTFLGFGSKLSVGIDSFNLEDKQEVLSTKSTKSEAIKRSFTAPGQVWRWVHTIQDSCGSAEFHTARYALTSTRMQYPCCLPGYAKDQANFHDPGGADVCEPGTPNICGKIHANMAVSAFIALMLAFRPAPAVLRARFTRSALTPLRFRFDCVSARALAWARSNTSPTHTSLDGRGFGRSAPSNETGLSAQ